MMLDPIHAFGTAPRRALVDETALARRGEMRRLQKEARVTFHGIAERMRPAA
jgi:hypothetical protein